jgi:hypothetical protein
MKAALLWVLVCGNVAAQFENAQLGSIDFYGLNGLDARVLRAALTVSAGDKLDLQAIEQIGDALAKAAGRPFTHISPVCCDANGRWMLYVGFGSKANAMYRPRPSGAVTLPSELTELYDKFMAMVPAWVQNAGGKEDDYSRGYSLSAYPPMRAIQEAMRVEALKHGAHILRVLAEAADDRHRIAAAHLTGYTRASRAQIAALVDASRDPNETVRNNAIRALGVLAATSKYAKQIPVEPFIELLNSATWTDRNKGLMLLSALTRGRDPRMLNLLREKAMPALIEMAQWQNPVHAGNAILLLDRIAAMRGSSPARTKVRPPSEGLL